MVRLGLGKPKLIQLDRNRTVMQPEPIYTACIYVLYYVCVRVQREIRVRRRCRLFFL